MASLHEDASEAGPGAVSWRGTSRQVACQTEVARSPPVSSQHVSEQWPSLRSQRAAPKWRGSRLGLL